MTLRNVMCVDVMVDLKRMIGTRGGHDDRMKRLHGGNEERLDIGETPGVDGDEREDGTSRAALCGQRTVRVAVNSFHVWSNLLTLGVGAYGGIDEGGGRGFAG